MDSDIFLGFFWGLCYKCYFCAYYLCDKLSYTLYIIQKDHGKRKSKQSVTDRIE